MLVTLVVIVAVAVIPILAVVLMRWLLVSWGLAAVVFILNGVGVPIRMISFPIMKTCHAKGFATQPDMAWSQIVILTANDADVLIAVPVVIVRIHPHCHHGRGCFHGHAAIGPDHAAGHQCRGRQTCQTCYQGDAFNISHVFHLAWCVPPVEFRVFCLKKHDPRMIFRGTALLRW
jgi:hypothetical protein